MDGLRKAWTWLKWLVGIALIAGLAWLNREGLANLQGRQIQWPFLAGAFVFCTLCALLTFFRWYLLVWGQGFKFRYRDAMRLGFLGQFLSYFGPGIVGGDLAKAIMLARDQSSRRTVAVATIFLDRVMGLLALFVLGATMTLFVRGLPNNAQTRSVVALLWTGAILGLGGVGLMLIPGVTRLWIVRQMPRLPVVGKAVGELINGVVLYQSRPAVLIGAVAIGLVSHAALIGGFYCGARAVEPWVVDLSKHFYFMPMAELFATLLPTPGGLGGLEGAVQYSYEALSQGAVPAAQAANAGFIAAVVFRLVQLAIACAGSAYYFFTARKELAADIPNDANKTEPPPAQNDPTADRTPCAVA